MLRQAQHDNGYLSPEHELVEAVTLSFSKLSP